MGTYEVVGVDSREARHHDAQTVGEGDEAHAELPSRSGDLKQARIMHMGGMVDSVRWYRPVGEWARVRRIFLESVKAF